MEINFLNQQILYGLVALTSAASWAFGGVLWRKIGEEVSPFGMNLSKGIIGSLYLLLALLVIGIEPMNMRAFIFLGISGLIGIAIGDTLFFMSLMQLGPRLTSLMGTLIPVLIVLSAVALLGERPSFLAWTGIFFTISGVAWVLWESIPENKIVKNKSLGISYSLLSIICMTTGVLFAKIGIKSVPTVQATFIRLFWGAIGLILWGCLSRQLNDCFTLFRKPCLLKKVSFIVFILIFGGFWLSLLAIKYLDVSIAGILNSTTPLFILPISAIMLKEKITMKSIVGSVIAVLGVALIFMGK